MRSIARSLVNFLKREDGVTALECALMLALVVVICIVALNKTEPTPQADQPIVIESSQR